ncbi:MAG: GTP 3',8-cyclase MoaA [Burkholderiaceae bacterium]|nr:GTP 3',8-cyclase MoaA [Burkholderiaceae bacterium]
MKNALSPLIDRFGRKIEYLRLSVTDRCDLRCSYCLPKSFKGYQEPKDWLTFDEIERVIGLFARLGTSRVRLTGGEPLLRRNLPALAARLSVLPGITDLSLSTNGTQLPKHAQALRAAGVRRLNISLDTLSRECMTQITGRDSLDDVMAGLAAAQEAGFSPIKLNMVVMPAVNAGEVEAMTEFCIERGFILRLIETMPVGATGLAAGYAPLGPIVDELRARFNLIPEIKQLGGGPARYWRTADGRGQIGVITPISQHFCATCNRVRLSVDGTLYLCLGQEEKVELRPLLRGGASDDELIAALRGAIELKPERHEFREAPTKIVRFMSQTGG